MKLKQKIGLIGVGNMGTSILEGLFKQNLARPDQVWVYDKIAEKIPAFKKAWKVNSASSSEELVRRTNVLLLAIKPQDLAASAAEFKSSLTKQHVLISILAGTPIQKIKKAMGAQVKVVRAMPNLGAKVGESITALTGSDPSSLALAEKIFAGCGKTLRLPEKQFDVVTALSGSGPAYFFLLMEIIGRCAEMHGFSREAARLLAVQTAVGAGKLAQHSEYFPDELRKMVTSKGGTTEAALKVMEEKNFGEIFHTALIAARDRSRELSKP